MIFVGDALFLGGNDEAAKEAGIESIATREPNETKRMIEPVLACAGRLGPDSTAAAAPRR